MKRILSALLPLLMLIGSSAGMSKKDFSKLKDKEHRSMHEIIMVDRDSEGKIAGGGLCTAYAVGPHTLLTAEHCNDEYTNAIYVDADKTAVHDNKVASYSVSRQFDHEDHMLLNVSGVNFVDYTPLSAATQIPMQGDHYYFWGNPEGVVNQYREGVVMGSMPFKHSDDPAVDVTGDTMYNLTGPVLPGDSGSSLFNSKGERVAVITYGIDDGAIVGAFPIKFTQDQIDKSLMAAGPDSFLARPPDAQTGDGDSLFLRPMQRRVGPQGSSHGEHSAPREGRGPRAGYHSNGHTRDHFHGGRFDHDYYMSHFGFYHPFFAYDVFWYGDPYFTGSIFVFDDCGFEVLVDVPVYMRGASVYVVEVDGAYYLTSPVYPTTFVGLTVAL